MVTHVVGSVRRAVLRGGATYKGNRHSSGLGRHEGHGSPARLEPDAQVATTGVVVGTALALAVSRVFRAKLLFINPFDSLAYAGGLILVSLATLGQPGCPLDELHASIPRRRCGSIDRRLAISLSKPAPSTIGSLTASENAAVPTTMHNGHAATDGWRVALFSLVAKTGQRIDRRRAMGRQHAGGERQRHHHSHGRQRCCPRLSP